LAIRAADNNKEGALYEAQMTDDHRESAFLFQ